MVWYTTTGEGHLWNGGEHTDPGFSRWVLPARGLLKVFLKVSQI